jgi:hypothetical protein
MMLRQPNFKGKLITLNLKSTTVKFYRDVAV